MVKKISYWTAAGQFLEMVERQLEEVRTDLADTPLSDYQDALNSVTSDLQVRSCPALTRALVPLNVRKTSSCPMAAFSSPLTAKLSEVQLNEATVLMVRFLESIYPTFDEMRTEYTLFERMDGFFAATPTPSIDTLATVMTPLSTEQPSLFEKVEGLFEVSEASEWCPLPHNTPVDELFVDDTITSGLSVWSSRPQTYYCPSCKSWNSLENPSVPQLPVFVKSPLDSLKIYELNNRSSPVTGEMADDELTVYMPLSPTPSPVPSTSSTSSDDTYKNVRSFANITSTASDVTTLIPLDRLVAARLREAALRQQIALQEEVIEKQKAIIDAFTELNTLSKKLSDVKA